MTYAVAIAAGALTWSVAEYLIHRFDGHGMKGKTLFSRRHLEHHAKVHYIAPWYEKAITALIVCSILLVVTVPFLGWLGAVYVLSFVSTYLLYEWVHWSIHFLPPLTPYGVWARKHHFQHHFCSPKHNHGVTSAVWDVVFRTWRPNDLVRIPRRHVPSWMTDADGELLPRYRKHYVLAGRASRKDAHAA